jgi:hypothetical protein
MNKDLNLILPSDKAHVKVSNTLIEALAYARKKTGLLRESEKSDVIKAFIREADVQFPSRLVRKDGVPLEWNKKQSSKAVLIRPCLLLTTMH